MSKTKKKPLMYRQGDVLIVAVDAIPNNATEVPRTDRGVVLAEGEVTGHAHRIPSRSAMLYRTENDARYLRVEGTSGGKREAVSLQHEEHSPVTLPPGNYRISLHREYQPDAIRVVAD